NPPCRVMCNKVISDSYEPHTVKLSAPRKNSESYKLSRAATPPRRQIKTHAVPNNPSGNGPAAIAEEPRPFGSIFHRELHHPNSNPAIWHKLCVENFAKVTKTTVIGPKVASPLKSTDRRSTILKSKKLARNLNRNLNLRKRPKE